MSGVCKGTQSGDGDKTKLIMTPSVILIFTKFNEQQSQLTRFQANG